MKLSIKCVVVILIGSSICAFVQSAAIIEKRYIPVEVIYEESDSYFPAGGIGKRNLNEKIQLSESELLKIAENIDNKPQSTMVQSGAENAVKNLDEKVQLSPQELNEALKHLPIAHLDSEISHEIIPHQQSTQLLKASFPKVDEIKPEVSASSVLKQAEEIISLGLTRIKENIDKLNEQITPDETAWRNLNQTVQQFLEDQQNRVSIKQDNPNQGAQIIQNLVSGFQNFTGNFIQNFQQSQRPANSSEDEQPSFGQNLIQSFTGGVQQVVNNIQNLGVQSSTLSTVLGDDGVPVTTSRPNIFQNAISSFQQIFAPQQSIINLNQSDPGITPPVSNQQGPIQVIQSIGNQIGSAFSQATSFGQSTKPPGTAGDEGTASTTQRGPLEVIQSVGNQISNVFSQVNPFASTAKPGSEDEGTGQQPGFIQNVGQAWQNIIRPQNNATNPITSGVQQIQQIVGQPSTTVLGGNGTNPIVAGVQNVGSQIQGAVEGAQIPGNPLEAIQGVVAGSSTEKTKNDKTIKEEEKSTTTATSKKDKDEIMMTAE